MKQDLVGRKYNKLLVISEEEQGTKKGGEQFRRFKCLCDCGNTVTVAYSNLVFGHTKTCGCSRRQLRREHKNLVGQKFGRLTVIAEAEPRRCSGNLIHTWVCRCECGNVKTIMQSNLLFGYHAQSCGCVNTRGTVLNPDLTGNRYGLLTVVQKADKPEHIRSGRGTYWECECDCGGKKIVRTDSLVQGRTNSCGCLIGNIVRGVRFGKLTLLSTAPKVNGLRYWNVRCDCGKKHKVTTEKLLRASRVVCDCGSDKPRIDLTGQVFGRLTALMEVDPVKDSGGRNIPSWLCRCTCGKEVVVRRKNLLRKTTRSCGCLRRSAARQFDPMSKRQ